MIRDNFKRAGAGVGKIDRGEFVLHDKFRRTDIDLTRPGKSRFGLDKRSR